MFIGIPGSGKSTAAQKFKSENFEFKDANIWEADMFFIDPKTNEYKWNKDELHLAHGWCKMKVCIDMNKEKPIIVTNTFLTPKERKPYFDLAKLHGYEIKVITCNGEFQNIHNVPIKTIEKMKRKFIPFSLEELF